MLLPFRIQKSALRFPFKVETHLAVTWNNMTIVWGGYDEDQSDPPTSVVYCFESGEWIKRKTSGEIPDETGYLKRAVEVINDSMFIMDTNIRLVYSLDLNTWTWTRISPLGNPPQDIQDATSWTYRGKMYCFGGSGWKNEVEWTRTNQLFCYNTIDNAWEHPDQVGDIPSPRGDPLSIISGDTVFVFGGEGDHGLKFSDLHILNMLTMRWTKVHGNVWKMPHHFMDLYVTFTQVSDSAAILYGRYDNFLVLDLDKAKQLRDPSVLWTRVSHQFPRCAHASVIEPVSQRLWIIGGFDGQNRITSDIIEIPIKPSLKDLAIDCAARNISANDPRLQPGKYPKKLRDEIEVYRSRTEQ